MNITPWVVRTCGRKEVKDGGRREGERKGMRGRWEEGGEEGEREIREGRGKIKIHIYMYPTRP